VPHDVGLKARDDFEWRLASASVEEKKLLDAYLNAANRRVGKYLLYSPLFVATVFVPVTLIVPTLLGIDLARVLVRVMSGSFRALDAAAFSEGRSTGGSLAHRFG